MRLINTDPGFRAGGLLTAGIVPTAPIDPKAWKADVPLYGRIIDRISVLPGVQQVAFASNLPLEGHNEYDSFEIEGRPAKHLIDLPLADKTIVTPQYFAAMRIPVLRGRSLTTADTANTQLVAMIDQTAARQLWPNGDPIGKRIRYFEGAEKPEPWLTIVGITGAVKHVSMDSAATPTVYVPLEQDPYPGMELVVRSERDPAQLTKPVREAIRQVRPDLPVVDLRPAQEIVSETTWRQRFATQLIGLFAALALVMALVGAYGVILFSVSQRLNEFGIRIALGASRGDILGMVLREGVVIAGSGIVIGLIAAAALGHALGSLLFEVGAIDFATFAGCAFVMLATALLASYLPARRATKADPMAALRCD